MKKKSLAILALVCALSLVTLIAADVLYTVNLNMNATIAPAGAATITVNSVSWTNGQDLALNWGTIHIGDNTVPITIQNNVNTVLTPAISASSHMPSGWSLTLTLDHPTIDAGVTATGTLTLHVPTGASAGTYSAMTAAIEVSYTQGTVTW